MRWASKTAAVGIAAVALWGASGVSADVVRIPDPRDSDGPLDVRVAEHAHGRRGFIRHTIVTHGRWRSDRISCDGRCRGLFDVFISTDDDADEERRIQIFKRAGELQAPILDVQWPEDCQFLCSPEVRRIGHARVWRPNARTLAFSFARRKLGKGIDTYGWRIQLMFRQADPCPEPSGQESDGWVCLDYVPRPDRYVRHHL